MSIFFTRPQALPRLRLQIFVPLPVPGIVLAAHACSQLGQKSTTLFQSHQISGPELRAAKKTKKNGNSLKITSIFRSRLPICRVKDTPLSQSGDKENEMT